MLIQRFLRSATLTSLFTLSMALAHIVGGGELTISGYAPFVLIISTIIFSLRTPKELSGPELAAILLIFQISGHLCFAMPHNDHRMFFAHLVAVIVSFQLVRHFEALISSIEQFLAQAFNFKQITFTMVPYIVIIHSGWLPRLKFLDCHLFERAPPFSAAA